MYTVLIIDDEEWIGQGVKAKLERANVAGVGQIQVATGGLQGLEMARALRPDIIITDMRMPDMDGLHVIQELAPVLPHTKFIMLSGYGDYSYVREAFKYGVQDYLLKPAASDELGKQVQSAIAGIERVNLNGQPGSAAEQSAPSETVITVAEAIVREHYSRDLQLAEVANRVSMNYSYFSKLFKEQTGLTFTAYLIKVRMEEARKLLKDPTLRINEISEKVGYGNLYHFSRAFKNYFGVSPKEYRRPK